MQSTLLCPALPAADPLPSPPPPVPITLTALPEELLVSIIIRLADDDYHMLTLPVVCSTFHSACVASLQCVACRLASRLRQVRRCVVEPRMNISESEWALAHAWGALQAAQAFFATSSMQQLLSRIEALAASPEGIASMRDLLRHCAAVEQKAMPPEPASAEALFLEESARRLQPGAKASTLKTRAMPGDKAARDAAAALNLRGEVGAIAAVRKEAEAQAQRQVQAECRRNWKLLPPAKRREWERWAKHKAEQAARWHQVVGMTAELAREMRGRLQPLWGQEAEQQPE